MKSNGKAFNAIVTAALLSSGSVLANEGVDKTFIPIEKLSSSDRAVVELRVRALLEYIKIDFDSVEVGIGKDGKIILRAKDLARAESEGNPSCWTK